MSVEKKSFQNSGLLILSCLVNNEIKNHIGKSYSSLMDKLPKSADQHIIFDLNDSEFDEVKKISNEIFFFLLSFQKCITRWGLPL